MKVSFYIRDGDGELLKRLSTLAETEQELKEYRENIGDNDPLYVWIYVEGELVTMRESAAFLDRVEDPWFRYTQKEAA